MSRQLRIEFPGAYYHITARGNERKDIYRTRTDYLRFLSALKSATERYLAVVHAYCLMTNHYHLLVETPLGNLSQIMHHINTSYTTYYNLKRKRSGHLLQGRYKAVVIEADSYACVLSRYIHLNPVRAGMVAGPEDYEWSSYRGYLDARTRPNWLTTKFVLGYFGENGREDKYRKFVLEGGGDGNVSPLAAIGTAVVLGKREYVEEVYEERVEGIEDPNVPVLRYRQRDLPLELVEQVVEEVFHQAKKADLRKVAIHVCHRYSGLMLAQIGAYFGLSGSGVTKASKRFEEQMKSDKDLGQKVRMVKERLSLGSR